MDKVKNFYDDNKPLVIGAGVAAAALAAGIYFMRSSTTKVQQRSQPLFFRWMYDKGASSKNDKVEISLYKTEAMVRSQLIKDVKYNLFLSFGLKDGFKGQITTNFKLNSEEFKDGDLFLDFQGKAIADFKINGKYVDCRYEDQRVYFPKDHLKVGKNEVSLKFKNTYVTNSAGLHWFQDPTDDRVYLFSHLEPFFCHRIFPCFDQPDIKAPLSLAVHCPKREWVAIANGKFKERFDYDTKNEKVSGFLTATTINLHYLLILF